MRVAPGATYEAALDTGETGLVGTLTVGLIDNQGNTVVAFVSTGIIEHPAGTGIYEATGLVAPDTVGQYTQVWLVGSATYGIEDIVVSGLVSGDPIAAEPGEFGPCTDWLDGADVAACCDADVGSDTTLLDQAAAQAQELLYELSGGRYPGLCERTVRPCAERTCGFQILSRGHIVGWNGGAWGVNACSCHPLSRVLLAGFPVKEVSEVKIDGAVIAADGYRLDGKRWLTRLGDSEGNIRWWPGCQRIDLDDTEVGTWSVTYVYGASPPAAAVAAAGQLACEIWKACPDNAGECQIPSGTVRVTRQGLTIERAQLATFLSGGQTGLVLVDAFLSAYGSKRAAAFWSPDIPGYAQSVG